VKRERTVGGPTGNQPARPRDRHDIAGSRVGQIQGLLRVEGLSNKAEDAGREGDGQRERTCAYGTRAGV